MHHIDHEQSMLCISHGYTSLHRDRYSIYPIDIDIYIYNIDINIASTAGPPQGHRRGGGRGIPTIHHAWGGGCDAVPYIYICGSLCLRVLGSLRYGGCISALAIDETHRIRLMLDTI